MDTFALFCKSYKNDVLRARELAKSVQRFNRDHLPFYISVPAADIDLFREKLDGLAYVLLRDEDILQSNPRHPAQLLETLPGGVMQQIIKSEFWRLGLCKNYLMLDSDAYFIKSFSVRDFMYDDETPFTVLHEGKDLLQFAARKGMKKVRLGLESQLDVAEKYFNRPRRVFNFGPVPIVCSSIVWETLAEQFTEKRNLSFADLMGIFPGEMFWYGEAMLKYSPVRLIPVEPFFKVFHYVEQYEESLSLGETEAMLAETFLGIIKQSNWNRSLDFVPRKKRTWKTLWLKRR
jgi:hypothetical protein